MSYSTKNGRVFQNVLNLLKVIFCLVLGLGFTWIVKDILAYILFWGKGFTGRNDFYKGILLLIFTIVFSAVFWLISQPDKDIYQTVKKKKELNNLLFIGIFVITVYLIVVNITINLSPNIIYDETLYLTHMRLVLEGKVPYHDFYDWIPPVWLYLYAGVYKIFGENIVTARALSTALGISTIILAGRLSWRLLGRWAGLFTLGLIACVNPITTELVRYYYTAPATFFLFLAITIEEALPKTKWKVIIVELFLTLTAGTLQAFGLVLIIYPLYHLIIRKDKKTCLIAVLASLFWGLLLALPFLIIDIEATIWAMFSYNKEIMPIRRDYSLANYSNYWNLVLQEYYFIWIPILASFVLDGVNRIFFRDKQIYSTRKPDIQYLLILLFGGIALPVLLFNPTLTMQQHVYYLVIGCILVVPILFSMVSKVPPEWKILSIFSFIVILGLQFTASRLETVWKINQDTILTKPDSLSDVVSTAKDYVKSIPDARVFTFVPYLGVEAGAKIFPGTEYGITSFTMTWDEEKAARYSFFTNTQVLNWVETRQPDLIITVDKSKNTMYCCGPRGGLTFMRKFDEIVDRYYYLDKSWYVNDYWGIVRYYLPKE